MLVLRILGLKNIWKIKGEENYKLDNIRKGNKINYGL